MPTGREWRGTPIHRGTRSSEMVEGIAAVTGQRRDEIKLYDLRCVFNCFHRVPPRLDAASASIYDLRDKFARLTSALDRYRSIQCFQVGRNNWLSQSFLIFFSSFFVSFRRSSFPSFFLSSPWTWLDRTHVHANRFKSNSIEAPDHLPIARGKGRRSEVKAALPEVVSPWLR